MAAPKEIRFRERVDGQFLEGQQNKIVFRIHRIPTLNQTAPYIVAARDIRAAGPFVNTSGHRYFSLEDAKKFCQKIAAGEITLEGLREEFAAEDKAREHYALSGQRVGRGPGGGVQGPPGGAGVVFPGL